MSQPDARAFVFIPAMQTLKNNEDTIEELGFDADAVVANHKFPVTGFSIRLNIDFRCAIGMSELDGVGNEVLKQKLEFGRIGAQYRQIGRADAGAALPDTFVQIGQ